MMITGTSGKRCFTSLSSASPDSPGMRMSETSTCGRLCSSACCTSFAVAKVRYAMPSRSSAFSSTQRIERSSSTIHTGFNGSPRKGCWWPLACMRIEPRSLTLRAGTAGFQRQEDGEHRAPGNALAFDRSVVLRDESLGDRQPQPAAPFAPRHERIEDPVADQIGNARAVVLDRHGERQLVATLRERDA